MREVVIAVRKTRRAVAALVACAVVTAAGAAAAVVADAPPSSPEPLSLRLIKPKYEKATVKGTSPVTIVTAPERFAYAASVAIPEKFNRFESCDVTAVLKVTSGRMVIGALTRNQSTFVAQSKAIVARRKPAAVTIVVSPMRSVGELVFSNAADEDGTSSTAEVSKVTVGPCR
jgi:hypothetical protein